MKTFQIPISWTLPYTGLIHGIAGWFDINLAGLILSTSPTAEKTHWQQIRFLFQEPIAVNAMEVLNGVMNFKVNDSRSYDITVELFGDNDGGDDRMADFKYRKGSWKLHEQTYYYDQGPIDLTKPEFNSMYTPHY